ncbi:MAG: hypothetical protein CM15mP120_06110 [Pseudomonadota bacterium]|nr:MAG: hypothetical protein CM15mP120_06110 [Pseudomonadota bacterium]
MFTNRVKRWLAKGFAGDAKLSASQFLEKRLHPELLETETCRVISARMNYLPQDTQPLEVLANSRNWLMFRVTRWGVIITSLRKRLATLIAQIDESLPGHRYRAFTDSAPVLEKAWQKNRQAGWANIPCSYMKTLGHGFLGEIYTNAPIACTTQTVTDACVGAVRA